MAMAEKTGRLVMLAGAAGSGRHQLLSAMREKCDGRMRVIFPKRYICNGARESEADLPMSQPVFEDWRHLGFFALHWQKDEQQFAIGGEAEYWLEAGIDVVFCAGLSAVPAIRKVQSRILQIRVTCSSGTLKRRLANRDGFDATAIAREVIENKALSRTLPDAPVVSTDQALAVAADSVLSLVGAAACEPSRQVA